MKDNIVLTGATGFLGSRILEALLNDGRHVCILKRSNSDTWRINHLIREIEFFDVDMSPIECAFRDRNVSTVIHTACEYGRSDSSPLDVVNSNLIFGLQLLNISRQAGVHFFVNTDTLLPRIVSHYSLAKKQFVEWLERYAADMVILNLKLDFVYGPRDDRNKLVFWLLDQFIRGSGPIKMTAGKQLRDFIFIDDAVSAFYTALRSGFEKAPGFIHEFEVGSGALCSVREFVEKLYCKYVAEFGETESTFCFGALPYRVGEAMKIDIDNSFLLDAGWRPLVNIEKGIAKTISSLKDRPEMFKNAQSI